MMGTCSVTAADWLSHQLVHSLSPGVAVGLGEAAGGTGFCG